MYDYFVITLNQMVVLFVFMLIGFLTRRKNLAPKELSPVLSSLLVNVFLPALNFDVFVSRVTLESLKEKSAFVLLGTVMVVVGVIVAGFLAKRFTKNQRTAEVYAYSFAIANFGYLGYPLVEAVFGGDGLFSMMMYCIPYTVCSFTWGMYTMNPNKELNLKKLITPVNVAIVLGILVGLSGIQMPKVVSTIMTDAGNCMAPCAMILTGFVLAENSLGEVFRDKKMYLASLVRLIMIPAVTGGILFLAGVRGELLCIAVVAVALPTGLNSVVFPAAMGGDSTTGAKLGLVSNIFGLITLPVVVMIITSLAKM
jgi:predicted permease